MKDILEFLLSGQHLDQKGAEDLLKNLASGEAPEAQMAAVLSVYNMRRPSVAELLGFRSSMLDLALKVQLKNVDSAIDICGTGGDGKNTFNISTLSAFVVAASGHKVIKHGNYASSSHCGASNVLESLGVKFTNDENKLNELLTETNICFLHAPLFHPSMKHIAPVRKTLGIRTIFNILGPLVNPADPKGRSHGVTDLNTLRLYTGVFQETGHKFSLVYSLDGYDEISLTGPFKLVTNNKNSLIQPEELGLKRLKPEELSGGNSIEDGSQIFKNILAGKGTEAQNNVVAVNSVAAMCTLDSHGDFYEMFNKTKELIKSGAVLETFKKFIEINE